LQTIRIDSEVFFRDFLGADPKYGAVASILDRLRYGMSELLGRGNALSLSEFIDVTSIHYDVHGQVIPKDDETVGVLSRAMRHIDLTREALKAAASSGLSREQIAEGPTSIRIPTPMLCNEVSFFRFVRSLNRIYHGCRDLPSLISKVHALKIHQKPVFILFESEATIIAYFSPDWSMQEMRESIALRGNRTALDIYNAKTPVKTLCKLIEQTPGGHVKVVYLGKRNP
jgi:hypothetical protein